MGVDHGGVRCRQKRRGKGRKSAIRRFHHLAANLRAALSCDSGHERGVAKARGYRPVQVDDSFGSRIPDHLAQRRDRFGQKLWPAYATVSAPRIADKTVVTYKNQSSQPVVEQHEKNIVSINIYFSGCRDGTEKTAAASLRGVSSCSTPVEDQTLFAGEAVPVSDQLKRSPLRIAAVEKVPVVLNCCAKLLTER